MYDVNAQEVFLKSSFNIKISEPICSIMSQADKPTDASKSDLSQNDETETDETLAGKTFGNDVRSLRTTGEIGNMEISLSLRQHSLIVRV